MHTLCYGFSTPSLTLSLCAPSLVEPAVLATPPVAPLALLVVSLSSSSSLHTLTSSSTRLLNPSPFPSSHRYPHLLTPSPLHPLIYSPSEPFTPSPPHTWPCLLSASPSVSPLTPPHLLTPSPPHTLTSSPLTSSYPHLLSPPPPPHLLTPSPDTPLPLLVCMDEASLSNGVRSSSLHRPPPCSSSSSLSQDTSSLSQDRSFVSRATMMEVRSGGREGGRGDGKGRGEGGWEGNVEERRESVDVF